MEVKLVIDVDEEMLKERTLFDWHVELESGYPFESYAEVAAEVAVAYIAGGNHSKYIIDCNRYVEETEA